MVNTQSMVRLDQLICTELCQYHWNEGPVFYRDKVRAVS